MPPFLSSSQLSGVKAFLSPGLLSTVQQAEEYISSPNLVIGLLLAENRFLSIWQSPIQQQPDISLQPIVINQGSGLSATDALHFVDIIIVATSVMQLVTGDIYRAIEPIKTWKKPLFIFVHGFELIGTQSATIERKLSETFNLYPYAPNAVVGIRDEQHSEASDLLAPIDNHLNRLLYPYRGKSKAQELRASQKYFLETELRASVAAYLLPRQALVRKKTQYFQSELQTSVHSAELQKSQGTILTNYVRTYFDMVIASLNELEPDEILGRFDKKVQQSTFQEETYYYYLQECVLQYLLDKQKDLAPKEENLDFKKVQFLNHTASYWTQGLSVWEQIDQGSGELFQKWTVAEHIFPFFQDFFQAYKQNLYSVTKHLENKTEDLVIKYCIKFKDNLMRALKRSYKEKSTLGNESDDQPYALDDDLQVLNLSSGTSLPHLLKNILGSIRSDLVTAVETHRKITVATSEDLQFKAIATYTNKVIASLQSDYARFDAQYQPLLNFNFNIHDQ